MSTQWTAGLFALGVLAGSALSAYARSANGFLVGPALLLAAILWIIGACSGIFLIAHGRYRLLGMNLLSFCLVMPATFWLLGMVWPYQAQERPAPLAGPRHLSVLLSATATESDIEKLLCETVYQTCEHQQHAFAPGVLGLARISTRRIELEAMLKQEAALMAKLRAHTIVEDVSIEPSAAKRQ